MADRAGSDLAFLRPEWPAPCRVGAAVTAGGRAHRLAAGATPAGVGGGARATSAGRAHLIQALGLPASPQWLRQVHGSRVAAFDGQPVEPPPQADASVTTTPGAALAIVTADCLPILLCSVDGACIAAAHAGWRGLAAGVVENTVQACERAPDQLLASLGPCIAAASYEVGAEVRDAFVAASAQAEAAFQPVRPGHWLCDLEQLARQRLRAAGVQRVYGGGFDTFTDPRFPSWRRDGQRAGRLASFIWMRAA